VLVSVGFTCVNVPKVWLNAGNSSVRAQFVAASAEAVTRAVGYGISPDILSGRGQRSRADIDHENECAIKHRAKSTAERVNVPAPAFAAGAGTSTNTHTHTRSPIGPPSVILNQFTAENSIFHRKYRTTDHHLLQWESEARRRRCAPLWQPQKRPDFECHADQPLPGHTPRRAGLQLRIATRSRRALRSLGWWPYPSQQLHGDRR